MARAQEPSTIRVGFRRAGISPLNPTRLLGLARPLSSAQKTKFSIVPEMMAMLDEKWTALRNNLKLKPVVVRRGFLDTSKVMLLTSDETMSLNSVKEASEMAKK